MAVVEATVPADSSAGDTFDWLLPGSHGAVASVTVPAGAKGVCYSSLRYAKLPSDFLPS